MLFIVSFPHKKSRLVAQMMISVLMRIYPFISVVAAKFYAISY